MTTYSDAPAGSGLGSSSTMVVAIIKAYMEWLNLPLGEYDIAALAIRLSVLIWDFPAASRISMQRHLVVLILSNLKRMIE